MANADNAMYQAKATEHGSAIFFTEEMNIRLRERMQMEQDLNVAIELGQLALHFQPIFDAAGQRHRGAEVLLRWHHPEKGPISPADFIPLAEATGQIVAHRRLGSRAGLPQLVGVAQERARTRASWRSTYRASSSGSAFPSGSPS